MLRAGQEALMRPCVSRAALVVLVLSAAVIHAQSIDEIVAKSLQARGGAEKWKSVSSLKMVGKVSMQGMDLPITIYAKRPNYNRQEIMLQDKQIVQAFDGTTGWLVNPMMGDVAQELPKEMSQMMRNTADFEGALVNYKEKGHTVELVGKEKLAAAEVYHLKMTMKNGHVQHYYLDAISGVELKTVTPDVDVGTGQKQTIESEMSNFQKVDGIMIPHTMKQIVNGKPMLQMTLEKIEFNVPVDDAVFRMPQK
jgi:outer membrane lipoprotein-sorting protein